MESDLQFFDVEGIPGGESAIEEFRSGEAIIISSPSGKYIAIKVVQNDAGTRVGFIAKPFVN